MTYRLLNENEIINYAVEKGLFNSTQGLSCEEIGDGNINYVFRVKSENKSYILKQAHSLLRSSGRPLNQQRADIEAFMLNYYNKTLPKYVPKLHYYDKELKLMIMEDLRDYKNLRIEYIKGNFYPHLSKALGEFSVKSLLKSSYFYMDLKKFRRLQGLFINDEMCDITEDLVLTEPYNDYRGRNVITKGLEDFVRENIYEDRKLNLRVGLLKEKFVTQKQALLHGDLHSGSIFVRGDLVKVIDPEFAVFGPIGYDLGNVLGHMFFGLIYNEKVKGDHNITKRIEGQIEDFIGEVFRNLKIYFYNNPVEDEMFNNPSYIKRKIKSIMADMYSYCGTEIIRRTIGDSQVLELTSIEDANLRIKMDRQLLQFGKYLINSPESINSTNIIQIYHLWQNPSNSI